MHGQHHQALGNLDVIKLHTWPREFSKSEPPTMVLDLGAPALMLEKVQRERGSGRGLTDRCFFSIHSLAGTELPRQHVLAIVVVNPHRLSTLMDRCDNQFLRSLF